MTDNRLIIGEEKILSSLKMMLKFQALIKWKGALMRNEMAQHMYTQKNKSWIYVYFAHRFNAQTNYLLHAMCKMPLVQQVANSRWCNVS